MADQLHTKEPWISRFNGLYSEIGIENSNQCIATVHSNSVIQNTDQEDARRLVACVNACIGIETKVLEECGSDFLGHYTQMKDVESLRAINLELLTALKSAKECIAIWHGSQAWDIYDRRSPEMILINTAIAKAEAA
jgi:hypothetical protein